MPGLERVPANPLQARAISYEPSLLQDKSYGGRMNETTARSRNC
jgi:hypothetical protein